MFNGSHMCSKNSIENETLCLEHKCKIIITDTCNICLDEMKEYVVVKCGHSFHKECISEWLIKKTTCPCCRHSLKPEINIQEELNNIRVQINQYINIEITRDFIEWFFEMCRTYIEDTSNICLFDILYVIQTSPSELDYFMTVFNNDINYISIDLFELELKLNRIARYTRYLHTENNEEDNEDSEDSEDEDYEHEYEHEYYEHEYEDEDREDYNI